MKIERLGSLEITTIGLKISRPSICITRGGSIMGFLYVPYSYRQGWAGTGPRHQIPRPGKFSPPRPDPRPRVKSPPRPAGVPVPEVFSFAYKTYLNILYMKCVDLICTLNSNSIDKKILGSNLKMSTNDQLKSRINVIINNRFKNC